MKRAVLVIALIMVLFLATQRALFGGLASANPSPELDFPREPVATPPTIVVHSPTQNQNYNSTQVLLNFTITKPEAWLQRSVFYGSTDAYGNQSYDVLGNITSVYYVVDHGERQNISMHDSPSLFDFHPKPLTLNFSVYLELTPGEHTVNVGFEADSYYLHMTDDWNGYVSSISVDDESELIIFTVRHNVFPTTLVIATLGASLVAIGSGLLVYSRKRNHAENTSEKPCTVGVYLYTLNLY